MDQQAFQQWLQQVDQELTETVGLSHSDLADQPYADWFEGGMSAAEAAQEVLENEGMNLDGDDDEPADFRDDVDADADALRGIGWGTDEDYGDYDGGDW